MYRVLKTWFGGLWSDRESVALEYLTFGRRARMLFRMWVLQLVPFAADVEVFRTLHPFFSDVFEQSVLQEVYLLCTVAFLSLLAVFLFRMGKLTFAPRFHRFRSLCISMVGYVGLSGSIIFAVFLIRDLPSRGGSQPVVLDVLLGVTTTSALAALLALGFLAQFSPAKFPRRQRTKQAVGEWLAALDWAEKPEGSHAKDRRYVEFEARTEQVATLLDSAVTTEGRRLRREFEQWRTDFEEYGLLTRERIVAGDVRNSELQAQQERLERIVERLQFVADGPTDTR